MTNTTLVYTVLTTCSRTCLRVYFQLFYTCRASHCSASDRVPRCLLLSLFVEEAIIVSCCFLAAGLGVEMINPLPNFVRVIFFIPGDKR